MRHLKREIHLKQATAFQARARLATDRQALQQRTLAALATPQALLGSFGFGLAIALLLGRRQAPAQTHPEGKAAPGWLRLLLRDVVMPLALSLLQTRMALEHEHP